MRLATNAGADGNYPDATGLPIQEPDAARYDGLKTLYVWGSFGSGTVKLQVSPDNGTTWFDVTGLDNITAKFIGNSQLRGSRVRINVSGSSGPTINAILY